MARQADRMVVVEAVGGGVLEVGSRPLPEPGAGEARVRVAFSGVNHLDRMIAEETLPAPLPLPRIPGGEVSGYVEAVGPGVDGALSGAPVAIAPYLFCGRCEPCLNGRETLCRHGDILGLGRDGGYAEAVVVPAANLVALPPGMDLATAAALPLAAATAHHMLSDRAALAAGEWLLVVGVGGGVASAALRLGRIMGGRVIAASRSERKLERAKADGAEATVLLADEGRGLSRAVRSITGGSGADVVLDPLGSLYWQEDIASLARGGRLVTCGAYAGREGSTDIWLTFAKELSLLGSYGAARRNVRSVIDLAARGVLEPAIADRLPLRAAAEAHERLRRADVYGKLILEAPGDAEV
jgi:NADPH:quinone reductase-like Zn-dependent oxidoreductase